MKKKRTTADQLKRMAKNWQDYPERAAANTTQNVWIKLTAEFKISQKQAVSFTKSFKSLMETISEKVENYKKIETIMEETKKAVGAVIIQDTPFVIYNTDILFTDSPDSGHADCLCSRCGKPIMGMATRAWPGEEGQLHNTEYRYGFSCISKTETEH